MSQVYASKSAAQHGRARPLQGGVTIVLPALGFFATALVTRLILQETQSRLQITAFVGLAALLEQLRAGAQGRGFGVGRWLLSAGAATLGVLIAKHVVEPGSITDFVLHVLDRAGITAPAWLDPNT